MPKRSISKTACIQRRTVLKGSVAATVGTVLTLGAPAIRAAREPLKIGSWGGFFEEVLAAKLYPEFTAATGIEVHSVGTPIGDAQVVQLQQAIRAGSVPLDVSAFIPIPIERAANADILVPLDLKRIPNAGLLPGDVGIHANASGVPDGAAWFFYYNILVSLREDFPTQPTSWRELWEPRNAGLIAIMAQPEISNLIDITAATYFDGKASLQYRDDILQVLAKIGEMAPNVKLWYRDEAQFQNGLETGELPIGIYYNDVATVAQAAGIEIDRTFPEEGAVKNPGYWAISRNSELIDEAHEFINYSLDPAVQSLLARELGGGPVVPREATDLSDEEWGRVSTDGPTIIPEYRLYTELGDWTATEFSRVIAG